MKFFILTAIALICFLPAFAGTIKGTVKDTEGNPLPFASIVVKGTSRGAVANSVGRFDLQLNAGTYTLTCQYVGYKSEERKITIGKDEELTLDFILKVQDLTMEEVVVKRGDDPAIEIIRETIKKRDFYNRQVDSFTVDVYIKGLLRSRAVPDKVFGQKIDKEEMKKEGFDSAGRGILFLSESVTRVAYKRPDKYKLQVLSSRESGGGFGFNFPSFINFYTNNVTLFSNSINPRGFVSPISDNAFHYYRFRYEGNFFENGKMINRIRVTPRRKHEPLFTGFVNIIDGEWRFHSLELSTYKDYQLELIDTIQVRQIHAAITPEVWRTQNQVLYVAIKTFGFDVTGNFLNVYTNYDLEPGFGKKYFDRIVMSYDTAFNKKDSAYWSNVRPVPLEPDEKRDFILKDSLNQAERDSMMSKTYRDSINRRYGKLKPMQLVAGLGYSRTFLAGKGYSRYRFVPLLNNLQYNTVEGAVMAIDHSLAYNPFRKKHSYELSNFIRYGFNNRRLNVSGSFTIKQQRWDYRNRYLSISGGSRVSQFNRDNPIDGFTNSISTLFYRNNWMKIYENSFAGITYNNRLENGLQVTVHGLFENRRPLENTTNFSFFKKDKEFTPNHPSELQEIPFDRHHALTAGFTVSFQPGQRYIQFPYQKVPIGSKYPTLMLEYTRGIPGVLSSTADFDKWRFTVHDRMNLKLKGEFMYRISAGGFLSARQVDIPDFQHFIGNQTLFNRNYLNSFQLAPYYRYSNTERLYGLAHVEHHFNGLLTNKIPLFNKLKWHLVAGSNTFYVNRDNYYVEVFAGLENILKIFRVDIVTAYQAEPGNTVGVRVGMGGILGGMVQANSR